MNFSIGHSLTYKKFRDMAFFSWCSVVIVNDMCSELLNDTVHSRLKAVASEKCMECLKFHNSFNFIATGTVHEAQSSNAE